MFAQEQKSIISRNWEINVFRFFDNLLVKLKKN